MEDEINEGLCNIMHRLWALSENYGVENSVDDIKPYTVDNVPIRKLFIGNIAQRTTHKDLEKLFSSYGKLDSCYLKRNSGKSNYAFVTFNNVDDALKATKDGHNKKINLHNRDLRVVAADSWHQPDSHENQFKKNQKSLDPLKEISTEYILNEDAEIHKLNDDCLMHIFSFLPVIDKVKMERVCRRWRIVSFESWRSFKKLDLLQGTWGFKVSKNGPKEVDTPTLRKVLQRCGSFLTHINFSMFAEKLSSSTLSVVGKYCPNLQYIDITELNVSPAGIKSLINNCTNIIEFNLGHCTSTCDNDLSHLFSKNKKLRNLKIVRNSTTGKCFLNLPAESIESVVLSECTNISPCHFSNAIKTLSKMHRLEVEKCITFNDQAVRAIGLCSQNLKVLHFSSYYPMTSPNAMLSLAELVNLETLNVAENLSVQDEFLLALGSKCTQLKSVDISSCDSITNKGLVGITSLPNLQQLYINYLGNITDEVLSDMPKLQKLECRGCPNLRNPGLCSLIEDSTQIMHLDLSGCNNLSNKVIETAYKATKNRTNNIILKMFVGGTGINVEEIRNKEVSPFLNVLNVDLSEAYLRPDFDHNDSNFFVDELLMDDLDDIDDSFFDSDDVDDMYDYYNYFRYRDDMNDDDELFLF